MLRSIGGTPNYGTRQQLQEEGSALIVSIIWSLSHTEQELRSPLLVTWTELWSAAHSSTIGNLNIVAIEET
jgi:hypothetical protein